MPYYLPLPYSFRMGGRQHRSAVLPVLQMPAVVPELEQVQVADIPVLPVVAVQAADTPAEEQV